MNVLSHTNRTKIIISNSIHIKYCTNFNKEKQY